MAEVSHPDAIPEPSEDAPTDAGSGGADSGGAEGDPTVDPAGSDSSRSLITGSPTLEMLTATEPSPDLEDVDDPWNPELGGPTRMLRGFQKMFGVNGMPAIGDVTIGAMETVKLVLSDPAGDLEDDSETGGDGYVLDTDGV